MNPFISKLFSNQWLAHFFPDDSFELKKNIANIGFVKSKNWGHYINLGGTNTKGISYSLTEDGLNSIANDVFVVYDVSEYLQQNEIHVGTNLKMKKIRQYPGYLCDFRKFDSADSYFRSVISKSSYSKIKSYKRKLESDHKIEYKMFWGQQPEKEFNRLYDIFHRLMEARYAYKKEINNNLKLKEWNFYKKVAFPMIIQKKAGLFVTYDNEKPIAFTLVFFSDNIMFDTMRVFDMQYAKYRLGSSSIVAQIEWCFANKFEYLDFAKGDYEYKSRLSNYRYHYYYH